MLDDHDGRAVREQAVVMLDDHDGRAVREQAVVMLDDHDGRAVREQAVEDSEQGLHVEPKQMARLGMADSSLSVRCPRLPSR